MANEESAERRCCEKRGKSRNEQPLQSPEQRLVRGSRRTAQNVLLPFARGEREGGENIRHQIEKQDLQGKDRQGQAGQYGQGHDHHLADVAGEKIDQEAADIVEDDAALADRSDDAAEGIVAQYDVGGLARHFVPRGPWPRRYRPSATPGRR